MKKAAADGKEVDYGAIYRIGKSAIKDFKEQSAHILLLLSNMLPDHRL